MNVPDHDKSSDLAGIAARFIPVDWQRAWDAKPDQVEWLIEPLIEAGQSVALFAVPGTGKSLIALEAAAGLATGRPVLGNPARDPVSVVYVDVENRERTLVERLHVLGYKPADLGRLVLYSFPSLAALDGPTGGLQVLALAVTNDASIVVIDTTSRVVAGKENDSDTFIQFYRHTIVPLRARGIALLRLDHPGKDVTRGARGSSAKRGDVDSEWLLTKTTETVLVLTRQKEREHHGAGKLTLRRRFGPLRHDVIGTALAPDQDRVAGIVSHLGQLHVPLGAGRVVAARALREADIGFRNGDLVEAVRRRKAIPGAIPQEPISGWPNRSPIGGDR